ncbi:MAG TPA: Maf family protein [Aggregatilineales bacterium]|nr:Maf family protein [Aggregatilineales bacterium]
MKHLVLASTSPRRHDLLGQLGLPFEAARPAIDETPRPDEAPDVYVARLSHEKAAAVALAGGFPAGTLILSADTTVADGNLIIGKPVDADEAVRTLRFLRGRPHMGYSGVTVWDVDRQQAQTSLTATRVVMRPYRDEEIAAYVASGDAMGKAGSYAIQNPMFHPVASIEGCYTNVVGLPLCALCAMLREQGIPLPRPVTCSPTHLPCQFQAPNSAHDAQAQTRGQRTKLR